MTLIKFTKCPRCGTENPALTLRLVDAHKYESEEDIPDNRTYEVICLFCDGALCSTVVDNTLLGVKKLRDEMDNLYGKPRIVPTWSKYAIP